MGLLQSMSNAVEKLIREALQFYDLPKIYSRESLEKAKRAKIALYNPDKCINESQ